MHDGVSGAQPNMPTRAPGSPVAPAPGPQASIAAPALAAREDSRSSGKSGGATPGFSF